MGVWIELRCERRGEGRSEFSEDRCWSDDNEGPGELAGDSQKSIAATFSNITKDAASSGWKHVRGEGWVCPCCLAYADKGSA